MVEEAYQPRVEPGWSRQRLRTRPGSSAVQHPADLLRPVISRAGQIIGRRRRAGPAGLLVLGAGIHKTEQWLALNAARAIENSVYVAGVCQAPPVSVGRSMQVDPIGAIEADLGLEAGVRAVDISLETVARVRDSFPMFRQRRL